MSYAIIRNVNYKMNNLAGICRHNERKNINYSNKEIQKEKGVNNYWIKKPTTTYEKSFEEIREKYKLKGQIKKVSNVVCEYIITSDKEFFDSIGKEETLRYFKTAYEFVTKYKNLGEKYIISAKVHMDETTPHMHLVFIPVIHTKDKKGKAIDKIACSEFWKGKDSYKKLQDNFYEYVTEKGFNLQRGDSKENEHIPIATLKNITEYENIKYELNTNKIKQVDETNLPMVVEQNRKLVLYTNKLKTYLAKSYTAIEKVEQLQEENENLRIENIELKRKNSFLQKYIEKTFECVSILFNFSTDRLKRIVKDFFEKSR